jgi:hypothetical protein
MITRGLVVAGLIGICQSGMAPAQQRLPAFEVYGLTGAYFHGNVSAAEEWKPQFGAGVLAPVGRNWAALFDVTTSAVEGHWNADGMPGAGPGSNLFRERRVALLPSFVRLWRQERFSIYAGGGMGFEHERQNNRMRPIIGREPNGDPILADDFQNSRAVRTDAMLVLRLGTLVSVAPRVVLRAGFSLCPRYMDAKASKSLELGIGYRF